MSISSQAAGSRAHGAQARLPMGFNKVYYSSDIRGSGMIWEQSLDPLTYGPSAWWVAIKQKSKGKNKAASK